ncbi:hypothetical protein FKM82_022410 [Ascaphus truei]
MLAALSHYAASHHPKPPASVRREESNGICPQPSLPTYVELRDDAESEVAHLSESEHHKSSCKESPNRKLPNAVSSTKVSSLVSPPVSRESEWEDDTSDSSHSDIPSPRNQLPLRKLKETTASAGSVTSESSAGASNHRVKDFCASVRELAEEFKEVLTDSCAVTLTPAHSNAKPVLVTPQSSVFLPKNTTRNDLIRTAKKTRI